MVTRRHKLRGDTTAVEPNNHFPTDSGLIGDGVRVVSRLLRRAKAVLGVTAITTGEACRSRAHSVCKLSPQLHRIARRRNHQGREALKAAGTRLVTTARRAGAQGRRALDALRNQVKDPKAKLLAERLGQALPRLKQDIKQAVRRVLEDDPVPSGEKLVSLLEPHTRVIPRFKAGAAVELGRKVRPDEVEGGIISGFTMLE